MGLPSFTSSGGIDGALMRPGLGEEHHLFALDPALEREVSRVRQSGTSSSSASGSSTAPDS